VNNRSKLLISVLFIAVIVLCIGLTRFYFDVTKNTENINGEDKVKTIVREYNNMKIFENSSGFYGVLDEDGAIVIEPEWMEILDITPKIVLVSRRINDTVLIGGVDYEENVVLPFVFRSMEKLNDKYLNGIVAEDNSSIIYTSFYDPVFLHGYDSAVYENELLQLQKGENYFYYDISQSQPILRKVEMTCPIGSVSLQWRVSNAFYLNDLHEREFNRINECVEKYVNMLLESDFTNLPEISGSDYLGSLTKPGSFTDITFREVNNFSLSVQSFENSSYDFAFTILADDKDRTKRTIQVHLYFARNADNQMILTSSDLNFQRAELTFPLAPFQEESEDEE